MNSAIGASLWTVRRLSGALPSLALVAWPSCLAVLVLASRLPFYAHLLDGWDGANYALALRRFDLSVDQPHPPGYPLYVAAGGLVDAFVNDPALAYVVVSIAGSIVAVIALWLLARSLLNGRLALLAALFLITSPLFWFWGEVQSPYVLLALGSSLIAYLCLRAIERHRHWLWLAAVTLGLASGLRPDLMLFLLPLVAYAGLAGRYRPRQLAVATASLILGVLVWLLPFLGVVGGPVAYAGLLHSQAATALALNSRTAFLGVRSALDVVVRFIVWSLWGLGFLAVGLVPGLRGKGGLLNGARRRFFAVWLAPALLFYLTIHLGQAGYLLMLLPGLILLAVAGLGSQFRRWQFSTRAKALGFAGILAANMFLFVMVDVLPGASSATPLGRLVRAADDRVIDMAASAIVEHDAWLQGVNTALGRAMSPCCSAVVIVDPNLLRYPQYYFPQALQYLLSPDVTGNSTRFLRFESGTLEAVSGSAIILPDGITSLVWIGQPDFSGAGTGLRLVPVQGAEIFVLPITAPLRYGLFTIYPHGEGPATTAG